MEKVIIFLSFLAIIHDFLNSTRVFIFHNAILMYFKDQREKSKTKKKLNKQNRERKITKTEKLLWQ